MDTLTYISCNNKVLKLLEDETFILSFVVISLESKNALISDDKFTHLAEQM